MKGKIIGGVAAMSMALATFVSFGITASATDYNASALYNNYANNKPNVLQNGDRIKQDGGTTNVVFTKYPSILFLTHNYANGNTYKAEFKTNDGSYATVGSGNSRYRYWKVTYSKKERIQYVRDDYYITLTANDPTLTKAPTAKTITYNGGAQQLVNAGTATYGSLQYGLSSNSLSGTIPSAINAGTYTVYYRVAGNTNYNTLDTAKVTVTINKAASSYTTEPVAQSLTWSGEAQDLVTAGTTTCGTVQYKLGNDGEWSTTVPTATDAGTYTVYYKVVGDANHNNTAEKNVTATINKAASSYTTEPAANSLTWTGEAQALVTEGTANGGTVQYKLGNDGEWSTTVPTATAVGTYTVYYKVAGDANHNDIDENSVTVTISKADADYIAEPEGKTVEWTGEAQELVTAGTANGGEVQYKLGDGEWSTAVPTATDVGTYTVYYKAAGDTDHNDTAVKSVTATIGAKAAEATYKNIMDFGGEDYDGEASAWTVTVTPGSTAITSVDVKVNGKNSNGQWDNNTAISGGPMIFGVVVKAAAYKVESMTAVVNGSDIEATLDTKPID